MNDNASFTMFLEIKGKLFPLELGKLYLLGKEINGIDKKPINFIQLEEEEDLNTRHCVIEITHNENASVYDLLSLKGTLLNDKPLDSLVKTTLKNGDVLKLGKHQIKYIHDVHEMSRDSSGFLEVNKNTSDIIASSPDTSSQLSSRMKCKYDNFLVPSIQPKKSATPNKSLVLAETEPNTSRNSLNTSSTSLSLHNRRSDSFTIPETQYCRPRNSLNSSAVTEANTVLNNSPGKIKFNFGNLDCFDDDEEFCIPETQEVLPGGGLSSTKRSSLLSDIHNKSKEKTLLEEDPSSLEVDKDTESSQFRICTQDYNEGFGEEESEQGLHSQIIPLIKHKTIIFNNTMESSAMSSMNQPNINEEENGISAVKCSNLKIDQETTQLRANCSTPDIFDFDGHEARTNEQLVTKTNIDKVSTGQEANPLDEDEEDMLPTQVFTPPPTTKVVTKQNLNEVEKPCLEKENEDVLTLSDKENRCPVKLDPITDLPPTQLFEVPANRFHASTSLVSSAIKCTNKPNAENSSSKTLFNIDIESDEEDNLLTQAFLQPCKIVISSVDSPKKHMPNKCLNSTLLDDKVKANNPAIFVDKVKEYPSAAFKMPEKDLFLKKNSSATSESDLDLLMCTPQLIKDNIVVGKTEDLKLNVLAAKNNGLFGDETDEEDDDDQSNLVKLINVPKDTLDFDKLLPHLNREPNRISRISKEQKATKEAQKIYKFNISFGKELDEKQSKTSVSKPSSTYSRDERHAARDKEKEMAKSQQNAKTKGKRGQSRNKSNDVSGPEGKEVKEHMEKTNTKESSSNNKEINKKKSKKAEPLITPGKVQQPTNNQEKATRLRYRHSSADRTEKAKEPITEDKKQETPARRMTRALSKCDETTNKDASGRITKSRQKNKGDSDNVATQSVRRVTRCRSICESNESQGSLMSNSSSHKNASNHNKTEYDKPLHNNVSSDVNTKRKKVVERKRKAEDATTVVPPKVERTRLKSTSDNSKSTLSSSSVAVSISMTMVDQELFKNLVDNSKGLWNISKNAADCDILVMDKAYRTFKFLLAMARGIPIVTSDYLKKLNEIQSAKNVKISDYLFADAEFEKKYKFSLVKSLQTAKKMNIFKDYEFLMTTNILPNPQEIKAIIEASGGYVHHKNPPHPKENQKLYLVTSKDDKKEWHKYRRLNKNIIIVSTEAIMSAVMSQNCARMSSYTLA